MAELSSPQDDSTVIIVNGPKSYTVSKKILCSAIPHFEKMLSDRLTESKEEKIQVDFPVAGFHNIMMAVVDGLLNFNMAILLPTLNLAGYLCMEELKQKCLQYFYDNFTIQQLPVVLKSLEDRGNFPGILDVDSFEFFIEKYFLKMTSTTTFLKLSIETIEYICKLNLIVDSEYQIFREITRWIRHDSERKSNLERLLKCIRWCHVDEKEMPKFQSNLATKDHLESINCMPSHCKNNCGKKRIKNKSLIVIHEVDATTIRISSYDEDLQLFVSYGGYKYDVTLSHKLITNRGVSDIIYDSGRRGIRVDWVFRRYNYLDMIGKKDSHYGKILKYIFHEDSQVEVTDKPRGIMLAKAINATNPGLNSISHGFDFARRDRGQTDQKSQKNGGHFAQNSVRGYGEVLNWSFYDQPVNTSSGLYVSNEVNNPLEKYSGALDSIVDDGTGYCLITFHENSYFAYPFEYNWAEVQFQPKPSTQSLKFKDSIYLINSDPVKPLQLHLRQYNQSTKLLTVPLRNIPANIDGIEMVNHNGKLLLCDKLAEKIYCFNDFNKGWDLLYRIETKQKIIAVASIVLPTNLANNW